MHPFRQINMRRRQRQKWIDGLVGAPLGHVRLPNGERAGREERRRIGLDVGDRELGRQDKMLDVLIGCANYRPNKMAPYSHHQWRTPLHVQDREDECPFMVPPAPKEGLLPLHLPPSHPLYPSSIQPTSSHADPLLDTIPKRRRPIANPPITPRQTSGADRGPRLLTARHLSRAYQRVLDLVPALVYIPPAEDTGDAATGAALEKQDKRNKRRGVTLNKIEQSLGLDRSYMTPEPLGDGKVIVTRPKGWRAAPSRVDAAPADMQGEDLMWL